MLMNVCQLGDGEGEKERALPGPVRRGDHGSLRGVRVGPGKGWEGCGGGDGLEGVCGGCHGPCSWGVVMGWQGVRGTGGACGDWCVVVALHLTVDKWQGGVQDGDAAA